MKLNVLVPLFVIPLFSPTSAVSQQTHSWMETTPASASPAPKWTEADKKSLLTKAQHGDTGAQFWLGAAYEQGWFGKADFQEALAWLRSAARRGNADAQNALAKCMRMGKACNKITAKPPSGIEGQPSTSQTLAERVKEGIT